MNENIDLTKILKYCPKGTKLYSTIFGEVEFKKIEEESNYPIVCVSIAGNNCDVTADGRYYDAFSGECTLFPSKDQRDWTKFTAPWLKKERDTITWPEKQDEREEPQVYEIKDGKIITYSETDGYNFYEPKFHKGQWIACKGLNTALITNIVDNKYEVEFLDGNKGFSYIDYVDRLFHLWTIQDAKDGDVLCCKSGWMCIFKAINNHTNTFSSYCFMDRYKWFCNRGSEVHILDKEFIKSYNAELYPATKEQRDILFQKMKEAGYEWNAKTKTLEELIKPKFDPKTLKPFDRVLVKDISTFIWKCNLFSHINEDSCYPYKCIERGYRYCIPFNNDTKHLIGTTEEASEYYRYWEE